LRGCIGSLTAVESISADVQHNAQNAAFHDPRFGPLTSSELDQVDIEVSILTRPARLAYTDGQDLLTKLRPGIDGVIIRKGSASATFLPQVWQQLPDKTDFLAHLCQKAGLSSNAWRSGKLEVKTYQVQYFEETP
jgi:AmmeMemoRadiSam system protein A